jgi:hypothetical protein
VGPPREHPPRLPAPSLALERNPFNEVMARIAALVADLMLASRVQTSLRAAGHEVEPGTEVPDELHGVDLVVADLDAVAPERLGGLGVPVIGFYQHTDVETKARAEEAGLAMAVPRSRMVRELPELVGHVLD